ncbi:hypothetical protein [Nakamurella endophytica]|uniref:Uncharacterized protein n=1 Tax=Nakamurella endophytica TaxID=1748367 RepID=A0A917T242_9ACTN|nr:hypothetical protein [Nakamurella endophytica]GGM05607.1 hypothetical protein GCM10011594_27270 [Nakamurella endophytica]
MGWSRRRERAGSAAARRASRLASWLASGLILAGCTTGGTPAAAPLRLGPLSAVHAVVAPGTALAAGTALLAVSPDGTGRAVVDAGGAVCVRRVHGGSVGCVPTGASPGRLSAAFSPDSRTLAVGLDLTGAAAGRVWTVDTGTGAVTPVPAVAGVAARRTTAAPSATPRGSAVAGTSTAPRPTSAAPPAGTPADAYRSGAAWVAMAWNVADGHLVLLNLLVSDAGPSVRVVDLDPVTAVPRLLGTVTRANQGVGPVMAVRGDTLLVQVYVADRTRPDLATVDLASGAVRDLGQIGSPDTTAVPYDVAPDGRTALVGSAGLAPSGPPGLLDLSTGRLTAIPGLTGTFVAGGYAPDGTAVAAVTAGGTAPVQLWLAGTDGSRGRGVAGTVGQVRSGARLCWSPVQVVAVCGAPPGSAATTGPGAAPPAWVLRG